FVRAITHADFPLPSPGLQRGRVDRALQQEIKDALGRIGLRKSAAQLKVGSLRLVDLIDEGPGYQDHLGTPELPELPSRRVRSYLIPPNTSSDRQVQLRRAAEREARTLFNLGEHRFVLTTYGYHTSGP